MSSDIKILIADDHPMMRDGVKSIFTDEPGFTVVGEAGDGFVAVKMAKELKPDVIIMDISMPGMDGIEAAKRIDEEASGIKIIMLSMHHENQYAIDAFKAGALGYVIKGASPEELVDAVKRVMEGQRFASPCVADGLFGNFVDMIKQDRPVDPFEALTKREREVLKLIADGQTSKEISEKLYIAPSTVKTHRANIMMKLEVGDIAGLVKIAIRKGLVDH